MAEKINEENGKWVTIKGSHVFIKDGETLEQAMARQFGTEDQPKFFSPIVEKMDMDYDTSTLHNILNNRTLGMKPAEKKVLFEELNDRIALHQQKLAKDFLSDCKTISESERDFPEQILTEINPGYEESRKLFKSGSHDPEAAAHYMNCQRCAQAFVLKWCHGYDVEAMPCDRIYDSKLNKFIMSESERKLIYYANLNGYNDLHSKTYDWDKSTYNNWQAIIFLQEDVQKNFVNANDIYDEVGYQGTEDQFRWIKKTVKQAGPGACYIASVCWKGSRKENGSYEAHTFCIINDKGKVKCVDPQSGELCDDYFTEKQIVSRKTELFRADACRLNGKVMKEIVKKHEK